MRRWTPFSRGGGILLIVAVEDGKDLLLLSARWMPLRRGGGSLVVVKTGYLLDAPMSWRLNPVRRGDGDFFVGGCPFVVASELLIWWRWRIAKTDSRQRRDGCPLILAAEFFSSWQWKMAAIFLSMDALSSWRRNSSGRGDEGWRVRASRQWHHGCPFVLAAESFKSWRWKMAAIFSSMDALISWRWNLDFFRSCRWNMSKTGSRQWLD
jgi:hypothetical protein